MSCLINFAFFWNTLFPKNKRSETIFTSYFQQTFHNTGKKSLTKQVDEKQVILSHDDHHKDKDSCVAVLHIICTLIFFPGWVNQMFKFMSVDIK